MSYDTKGLLEYQDKSVIILPEKIEKFSFV